jgi:hypothetical protein
MNTDETLDAKKLRLAKVIAESLIMVNIQLQQKPDVRYAGALLNLTLEREGSMWSEEMARYVGPWRSGEKELVALHALDHYKELVESMEGLA